MNNSGQPFLKFELQIGFDKEHLNFTHTYRNYCPHSKVRSREVCQHQPNARRKLQSGTNAIKPGFAKTDAPVK